MRGSNMRDFFNFRNVRLILFSCVAVGSRVSFLKVGVVSMSISLPSYSSFPISTVAFPLTAGRMTMSSLALRSFRAVLCSVKLDLGALAFLGIPQTLPLRSCSRLPSNNFLAPPSIAEAMSLRGIEVEAQGQDFLLSWGELVFSSVHYPPRGTFRSKAECFVLGQLLEFFLV